MPLTAGGKPCGGLQADTMRALAEEEAWDVTCALAGLETEPHITDNLAHRCPRSQMW